MLITCGYILSAYSWGNIESEKSNKTLLLVKISVPILNLSIFLDVILVKTNKISLLSLLSI